MSPTSDDYGTATPRRATLRTMTMMAWRLTRSSGRRLWHGSLSKAFMLRHAVPRTWSSSRTPWRRRQRRTSPGSKLHNVATPSRPAPTTNLLVSRHNRRPECRLQSNVHVAEPVDNKDIGRGIGFVQATRERGYNGKGSSKGRDKSKSPGKSKSSPADSPQGSAGSSFSSRPERSWRDRSKTS